MVNRSCCFFILWPLDTVNLLYFQLCYGYLHGMQPNLFRFGLRTIFIAGILMAATSAVLFGTLMFVSHLSLFLALAYMIRFLEGFSMAVLWSTVLAILLASHPTRPAAVYALLDTTFGLGFSLGPVYGSFMYTVSGFLLPFCVGGAAIFSTGMLSLPLIGTLTAAAEKHLTSDRPPARPLFSSPFFLTALLATSTAAFSSFGFTLPLLELHLSSFGLTASSVGFCFLAFSATYTLSNVLSGLVTDSYIQPWTVCVTGLLCLLMSFFFLPFNEIPLKLVGLMFLGIGAGCVLVASYSCALNAALQMPAYPEDVKTYSLVSSVWTAAFAIGSFLGTSLAGLLFDHIGWKWSCAAVQGLISTTLVLSLVAACHDQKGKSKSLERINHEDKKRTEGTNLKADKP